MEKFNLENFPTSESAKKMLSYVSDGFYEESYVGKWMFQVMGMEYDEVQKIVEDLPTQFFPETATWGLMYHEMKWGLPVRLNLSYEERRRLIYQRRDYRAPITPYHMETHIANATGFEVHVSDIHDMGDYGYHPGHPNRFQVMLREHERNTEVNYTAIEEMVSQLKQSHTTFEVEHRQEFEKTADFFSGIVMTEFTTYEIQHRRSGDDIETVMVICAASMLDEMIQEEISADDRRDGR